MRGGREGGREGEGRREIEGEEWKVRGGNERMYTEREQQNRMCVCSKQTHQQVTMGVQKGMQLST